MPHTYAKHLILVKSSSVSSSYFGRHLEICSVVDTQSQYQNECAMREVRISPIGLPGTLRVPPDTRAVVAFVHGSGSSRFSPRNMAVAEALNKQGFATLLFDLLTSDEEADRANVFNIGLLRIAPSASGARWP